MSATVNDRSVWVIKDQEGCFAHKGSIFKVEKIKWAYMGFRTFSEDARGYVTKVQAKKALADLNNKKILSEFEELSFHLEECNLSKIIHQYIKFKKTKKNNVVLIEKEVKGIINKNILLKPLTVAFGLGLNANKVLTESI